MGCGLSKAAADQGEKVESLENVAGGKADVDNNHNDTYDSSWWTKNPENVKKTDAEQNGLCTEAGLKWFATSDSVNGQVIDDIEKSSNRSGILKHLLTDECVTSMHSLFADNLIDRFHYFGIGFDDEADKGEWIEQIHELVFGINNDPMKSKPSASSLKRVRDYFNAVMNVDQSEATIAKALNSILSNGTYLGDDYADSEECTRILGLLLWDEPGNQFYNANKDKWCANFEGEDLVGLSYEQFSTIWEEVEKLA